MSETIVTAANGTEFTVVREVRTPRYGETVAFYDRANLDRDWPRGQFVAEYTTSVVRDVVAQGAGLNLSMGTPAWQIDSTTLREAFSAVTEG